VRSLDSYWYQSSLISYSLLPLSWLYCALAAVRRAAYRYGLFKVHSLPVPVVIVGNISVGGTGKTPLVTAIVDHLQAAGFKPGVISRGYGGQSKIWPQAVTPKSETRQVGDEAVLIARRCNCPMMVGPNRVATARRLLASYPCDVIVSDDGMQHYALGRDIEIAVIDGERRFGNEFCLPAGPLRESAKRLKKVDFVICNGADEPGARRMDLAHTEVYKLPDGRISKPLSDFKGQKMHAIAGIGNPQRFFKQLTGAGIRIEAHPFPDHHPYQRSDLAFGDQNPVLMTEKDAVKCSDFSTGNHWWVGVAVRVEEPFFDQLIAKIRKLNG